MLYPIKFEPYFKSCVWGGDKLHKMLGKKCADDVGESWEISAIEGKESVVSNGFLAGNTLPELVEVYMDELVGERVWNKFHTTFPLLFKFIDAERDLSIQVHPNDEMAKEKHDCLGKTEMSYIVGAEPNAKLYLGFNEPMTAEKTRQSIANGTLETKMKAWNVKRGDTFLVEAGSVHALGKGILIAEVQESSDITYRLYDYNRPDKDGNLRELHVEDALEAMDWERSFQKVEASLVTDESRQLVKCDHFTTNYLHLTKPFRAEFAKRGSFTVFMCVGGRCLLKMQDNASKERDEQVTVTPEQQVTLQCGETVLIPAEIDELEIVPMNSDNKQDDKKNNVELLEIYI